MTFVFPAFPLPTSFSPRMPITLRILRYHDKLLRNAAPSLSLYQRAPQHTDLRTIDILRGRRERERETVCRHNVSSIQPLDRGGALTSFPHSHNINPLPYSATLDSRKPPQPIYLDPCTHCYRILRSGWSATLRVGSFGGQRQTSAIYLPVRFLYLSKPGHLARS